MKIKQTLFRRKSYAKRTYVCIAILLFVYIFAGCKNTEVRNDKFSKHISFYWPEDCLKIIEKLNLVITGTFPAKVKNEDEETAKEYLIIVLESAVISEKAGALAVYSFETREITDFRFSRDGEKWYDWGQSIADIADELKI